MSSIQNESISPADLIQFVDIETALKNDKGPSASLKSFNIKKITTEGDNYSCFVTSVIVNYSLKGKHVTTSYIVKVNPLRTGFSSHLSEVMFEKELGFYRKTVPLINDVLQKMKEPQLRVPAYFHGVDHQCLQVLYIEDLRLSGYKMYNRLLTLDKIHLKLVLRELARLHGASWLLQMAYENRGEDFFQSHPELKEIYTSAKTTDTGNEHKIGSFLYGALHSGKRIAKKINGYDHVVQFAESFSTAEDVHKRFVEDLTQNKPFKVICHGDCWVNNFMFR